MSTQKRFIPETEAQDILERGLVGVLSTVSPDGQPYGVPVHYCYSKEENCVFFHCAKEGRMIENLTSCPQVAFLVIGPFVVIPERISTNYESAMAFGRAEIAADPVEKAARFRALCVKYAPGTPFASEDTPLPDCSGSHIVKIVIERVTGKRSRN